MPSKSVNNSICRGDLKLSHDELRLDPVKFKLISSGQESRELTSLEYRILSLFVRNDSLVLKREAIIESIWGGTQVGGKTLNVHFSYLRKKLRPIGLNVRFNEEGMYEICQSSGGLQ